MGTGGRSPEELRGSRLERCRLPRIFFVPFRAGVSGHYSAAAELCPAGFSRAATPAP